MPVKNIITLSIGTAVLLSLLAAFIGICLLAGASIVSMRGGADAQITIAQPPVPTSPPSLRNPNGQLPNGRIGEFSEEVMNNYVHPESKAAMEKYGELNVDALTETKEGPIMDAIRARRAARTRNTYSYTQYRTYSRYYVPVTTSRAVVVNNAPALMPVPVNFEPEPEVEVEPVLMTPYAPSLPVLPDIRNTLASE